MRVYVSLSESDYLKYQRLKSQGKLKDSFLGLADLPIFDAGRRSETIRRPKPSATNSYSITGASSIEPFGTSLTR